jgi:hypothetical protein
MMAQQGGASSNRDRIVPSRLQWMGAACAKYMCEPEGPSHWQYHEISDRQTPLHRTIRTRICQRKAVHMLTLTLILTLFLST